MYDAETRFGRELSGLGAMLGGLDWNQTREEIERECSRRIVLAGLVGVGKSTLFNRLCGWDVSATEPAEEGAPQEDLGGFRLIDLPPTGPSARPWPNEGYDGFGWPNGGGDTAGALSEAALVVFVLDAAAGLRPAEYGWLSWVRALGRPILVVLNKVDLVGDEIDQVRGQIEARLAARVIPLSALEDEDIRTRLIPQMLRVCPDVALPLARDLMWGRPSAARVVIQQAALWSAIAGLEPVPLLDLPMQLGTQQRLVMRLAAMYGQPAADPREVMAAVVGSVGLRLLAQQGAKLIPVVGWVVSALLGGLSTWLVGWAIARYYESQGPGAKPILAIAPALVWGGVRAAVVRRAPRWPRWRPVRARRLKRARRADETTAKIGALRILKGRGRPGASRPSGPPPQQRETVTGADDEQADDVAAVATLAAREGRGE
ncbi:MAG: GTP-binding protein [Anaerolineae bacterium]